MQQFYDNTNVFVTGATGFVGKILIEKLLRSTNVNNIYILIREKNGRNVESRINDIFNNVIFSNVRKNVPDYKEKIILINGDFNVQDLGINVGDLQLLINNVNIVFHVGANMKFNDTLKFAYNINVNGTRSVLDICKKMVKLKSMMYVSTIYSNCHLETVSEMFYDYPYSTRDIEDIFEELSEKDLNETTKQILGDWLNTYTFTKALAESVIKEESAGLPIGVFRPAIVTPVYKEPVPSWIDNVYGPTGIFAGVILGLSTTMRCIENYSANIVPVDTCVAGLIAAAWEVGEQSTERTPENIKIYNYVPNEDNPLSWGELRLLFNYYIDRYPLPTVYIRSTLEIKREKSVVHKCWDFLNIWQGIIIDAFSVLQGRKPRVLKVLRSLQTFLPLGEPFLSRKFICRNDNVQNLALKMSEEDKAIFPFSMANVHWLKYLELYTIGIRKYIIKEPNDTIVYARRRMQRIRIVVFVLKYFLIFILMGLIWKQFL